MLPGQILLSSEVIPATFIFGIFKTRNLFLAEPPTLRVIELLFAICNPPSRPPFAYLTP